MRHGTYYVVVGIIEDEFDYAIWSTEVECYDSWVEAREKAVAEKGGRVLSSYGPYITEERCDYLRWEDAMGDDL